MSGQWVKRKADEHVCEKPSLSEAGTNSGDVWRCNVCHALWTVRYTSDQRDPLMWSAPRFPEKSRNSLAQQRDGEDPDSRGFAYGTNR